MFFCCLFIIQQCKNLHQTKIITLKSLPSLENQKVLIFFTFYLSNACHQKITIRNIFQSIFLLAYVESCNICQTRKIMF